MNRKFRKSDSGRKFRLNDPSSKFHDRVGELEGFPLADPGSAEPGEGILWFGPVDDRDGWDYVKPSDVEEA